MALPTSDIDVIFDSRRQLSRMVHSARRHPKMQPFGVVEEGTWFNRRGPACRAQFRYLGPRRDAFDVIVDACARDRGTALQKTAHMAKVFKDDLAHNLGLNVKRWWKKIQRHCDGLHANAKPNSYKLLLLVGEFLDSGWARYLRKDPMETELNLRFSFFQDFLGVFHDVKNRVDPVDGRKLFDNVAAKTWVFIRHLARLEADELYKLLIQKTRLRYLSMGSTSNSNSNITSGGGGYSAQRSISSSSSSRSSSSSSRNSKASADPQKHSFETNTYKRAR